MPKGGVEVNTVQGWTLRWIVNIAAIIFTAALLPGFHTGVWAAIVGSIVLGIINAIIRPVVLLLTLPVNIVSLGLFTLVVNGFMLWLVSATIKGFDIQGFGTAILAALLITILSSIFSWLIKD
jgi:putative membrane protein